jgi:hypothetical protein
VENFPSSEIFLVNPRLHQKTDLKRAQSIDPGTESELMTLLIGDRGYIDRESDRLFSDVEPFFQCLPNPVDDLFSVKFSTPFDCIANIALYDLTGRKVLTIKDGFVEAGYHEISSGSDFLKSGIYLCRMTFTPVSGATVISRVIRLQKR